MATSVLLQLTSQQPHVDTAQSWLGQEAPQSAVQIVNPDSALTIEAVRQLQTQASYRPYQTDHQWLVITRVDQASLPAQHALLKIVEEPPEHTSLLLTTQQPSKVLTTLQSRCRLVQLEPQTNAIADPEMVALGRQLLETVTHSTSYSQLITWAEPLKDRAQAQLVLAEALRQLHTNPKHPSPATVAGLNSLSQGVAWLDANANVRLALEQTLFRLYQQLQNS